MNQNYPLENQQPLIGLAVLAKMAFLGQDLSPIGNQMLQRIAENPNDANAIMDMSVILHLKGNRELGLALQHQALEIQKNYHLNPKSQAIDTRLLVLVSPGDLTQNNVVEFLLERSQVALDMLYVTVDSDFDTDIPEHDVMMIAVSESDRNKDLLEHIAKQTLSWPRPVINLPENIIQTCRDEFCKRLKSQSGMVIPVTVRAHRQSLEKIADHSITLSSLESDLAFPIIVRPVDSHKGMGLKKLTQHTDLIEYLNTQHEEHFYISRFVDYQSQDGLFRKYRIVLIGGKAYACHMAISEHWMVHYMSAGMTVSPEKREEEALFMTTFDNAFGLKHLKAFDYLAEHIGLEYVGIDCGETTDGELLVFEVDSSMTIHAMDPIEDFPYKHVQLQKVFNAFIKLLEDSKSPNAIGTSGLSHSHARSLQSGLI
jgi:glutathione synthase/RimK-type ligase-like ATP-grasp enzyme